MCKKVQEITEVTMSNPPDMKKLQLKLQGSVGTQVCKVYSTVERAWCFYAAVHSGSVVVHVGSVMYVIKTHFKTLFLSSKVNAGPLAYAKAFLHENVVREHPPKLVSKLKLVYR